MSSCLRCMNCRLNFSPNCKPQLVFSLCVILSCDHFKFLVKTENFTPAPAPVSSEISDLCEISNLLLFVNYFASLSNGMKFGDYFFDVCYAN